MASRTMYGRDLVDAIMERDVKRVKELLKKGANTDFMIRGDKAIHLAARYGQLKTLKYLIEYEEDVNKQNQSGNTALHYAAREGLEDIVKLLIRNGALLNKQNNEGETPLHGCVGYQPMDVIERYIAMGMDVNTQTKCGDTPLHRAVQYSREESVEALLLCKADPNLKNNNGKRADQIAKIASIGEQIRTHGLFSAAMDSGYIQSQGMKLTHHDVAEPLTLDRVGIVIEEMDLPSDFATTFYCRREKSENTTVRLNKAGDEIIISDIYILRVREVYRNVDVKLTLGIYAKPSEKEDLNVKFPLGKPGKICGDVFEKDDVPHCTVTFTLVPETTSVLYLCVSPKAEVTEVGVEEAKIESEVNPDFALEIPEGAFKEHTALSLKVFEAVEEGSDDETENEELDEEGTKDHANKKQTVKSPGEKNGESNTSEDETDKVIENGVENGESEVLSSPKHNEKTGHEKKKKKRHGKVNTSAASDNEVDDPRGSYPDASGGINGVSNGSHHGASGDEDDISNDIPKKKEKKKEKKKKRSKKKDKSPLMSDVYEINLTGEQPSKGLKMQIPLKQSLGEGQELQIVRIDDDENHTCQALPIAVTLTEDGLAVFEASHFSTYVIITRNIMRSHSRLDTIQEYVNDTKARKQEARFFVMLRQLDAEEEHGRHVLLVECIRAGASGRRRNRWRKQGYEKQKPKNSKRFKLAPGQEFYIELKGEAMFDQDTGETGTRKLSFSPHRASYQPFNIRLPPLYQTGRGTVSIYPMDDSAKEIKEATDQAADAAEEGDSENKEPIVELKIQLHLPPPEDPFSEELETLADYKTLAEVRAEAANVRAEARAVARRERRQREEEKKEMRARVQQEIQEQQLPGQPEDSKEVGRFTQYPVLKINI